jgi:hypothetical protein
LVSLAITESVHRIKVYLPTKYHYRKELASGKLDKEICDHRLPDELRDIDNGTEPAVLIPDQMCVFDQTEHGGIAQGSLV